ncbi:ABC transporter ATP-binding protein [Herbidospora sp. NBRC 101105]|uniref:ABC transporter ATP-binding protein n=1 Tax=Herbidospora sp. NBRC 101105 TaxID=3032195 RepID=UPI0024A511D7|nr:ABC transporter ATP-binding protein [Herbidospora sp. NBRC 101105]GLX97343.1 ABC transporter ATP-binding protein [Herbidospora sp. NBRC 101105]
MLEARNLGKSFGRTTALTDVSLTVAAGEIVAVTGPSGAGKSTVLHCLAGVVRPESGEVVLDGRRIDTLPEAELTRLRRESFGVVFQSGELVPELTAAENVALPMLFNRHGRPEAMTAAAQWLDRLEVSDCAGRRTGELSGGQRQRVAVARALVTGPRVVFADEPTGALDTIGGEQVMNALIGTARAGRTAVVLVTHDNRVAAYADREIVLRDGAVLAGVPR